MLYFEYRWATWLACGDARYNFGRGRPKEHPTKVSKGKIPNLSKTNLKKRKRLVVGEELNFVLKYILV